MGLDTTHGCWHGSYGSFMAWRKWLHEYTAPAPHRSLEVAWQCGDYDDQTKPINVLMNHSDCGGIIAAHQCAPLAEALHGVLEQMEESNATCRSYTEQFIAGLRLAAAAGEDVEFY